jgi:hypothetical protein
MKPPKTIDQAKVLWWAWSGEVPFGLNGDEPVHGFAVCRYADGQLYRLSCDRNWATVNDLDHATEEEAKANIPTNYDASRVQWVRYEG